MNKEMVEIMELKGELQELKTTTEEQITSITKRIKDNKNENKKLIETKFEEIMDTVNFSVNNNPNISKKEDIDYGDTAGLEEIVDRKLEGAIDKQVGSIVDEKISDYEKGREEDIGELTSVVEEIADRLVEENKGIKKRIKELENGYMTVANGGTNGGTNEETAKLVKELEQKVEGKVEELQQQEENNLGKIEGLEKQVEALLGKIENQDGNEELVEQISILDKKYQGGKLEVNEEIKAIRQQVEILKEKIVGENEIMNLIEQASGNGTEEIAKTVGDMQGVQTLQGENIKELQTSLQTQNEKIETIIALTKEQEQAVKKLEETAENKSENKEFKGLKDRFTELRDSQQTQEKKLSQIEGLQIYQNEKLKELEETGTKLGEIQEKIENLENTQTIKGEELVELKGKNDKQDEKIETLIELAQETEKELNNCREKIEQFDETIKEADEKIKNANVSKDEILEELNGVYGKQIDNFEDRVNLLEKNQNDQETKLEGYQTQIIGKVEEQLGTVKDEIDAKLEITQGKIEGKFVDYKTKQDEALSKIGKIENSLKKIGEKNQNFAVSLNYLNKNIEQYKDENDKKANDVQVKITDLEQKITNLQEGFDGNTQKIQEQLGGLLETATLQNEQNQNKITGIEETISKLQSEFGTKNGNNVNTITAIGKKVADLQEKQATQNEEISTQVEALGVKLDEVKENTKNELEQKIAEVQTANNTELNGIKEKIVEVEKIDQIIKDQEENSRKVKNLAIAMEERLEVYEGNFKSTIEEEISKTGVKQSVEEMNEKLTSQEKIVDSLNGGIEQLEGKITELNETISEKLQQQAEDNYTKLQAENELILDNKIKNMQAKSNKIFTKQLNQMQAENQSIISDQIDGINAQISAAMAKELERMKIENTRVLNEKVARMQIQAEAEFDKKIKKLQAEYEKKIKIMEQMINNLIQENSKATETKKRTSGNNATQVFAYEPIEDINNYKNLYKKVQNNKVKNVAKNFTDDLDDMDIINFFDEDQED